MEKLQDRQFGGEDTLQMRQQGWNQHLSSSAGTMVKFTQPITSSDLPYLLHWLRSGKNLDFCLLALCSCILTLLCHQAVGTLPSAVNFTSSPLASNAPIANLSRMEMMFKAGLFTTSTRAQDPGTED